MPTRGWPAAASKPPTSPSRRDGELALAGRLDDLINVKGKKVNPREVEQVLAGLAHVDDVRVLGVAGGDGACAVVRAVIACRPGSLAPAQVVAWCRARLIEHQVPRSVVLVEALPRTDRGKIDLAALARLRAAGRRPPSWSPPACSTWPGSPPSPPLPVTGGPWSASCLPTTWRSSPRGSGRAANWWGPT